MSELEHFLKLNRADQLFVDMMVKHGVGTKAVREINPAAKRPDLIASKRLKKPGVREAIAERTAEAIAAVGVTPLRTLQELVACAYFNPKRLQNAEGEWLPVHEWPDDVAAAVIGMDIEETHIGKGENRQLLRRVTKPRAAPKVEAIKLLMQYQKMLTEKHELSGPNGKPLAAPQIGITFGDGGPGTEPKADDGVETSA